MIEAKHIEFNKLNKLYGEHQLCVPSEIRGWHKVQTTNTDKEFIRQITYAKSVSIFLTEDVFSDRTLNELKWTSHYAPVEFRASRREIFDKLMETAGDDIRLIEVDPDITFNLADITDEFGIHHRYSLGNVVYIVGADIENAYFNPCATLNYGGLWGMSEIIFVGKGDRFNKQIYDYCQNNRIKASCVINAETFNDKIYSLLNDNDISIYIGTHLDDGIYCNIDEGLFKIKNIKNNLMAIPAFDIKENKDECVFRSITLSEGSTQIPDDVFIASNGQITKLAVSEYSTVELSVTADTMEDFINEEFDRSAMENNDNSARATRYRYTLNPPRFDRGFFTKSSTYNTFSTLADKIVAEGDKFNATKMFDVIGRFDSNGRLGTFTGNLAKCLGDCGRAGMSGDFNGISECKGSVIEDASDLETSFADIDSIIREVCVDIMGESVKSKVDLLDEQIAKNREVIAKMEMEAKNSPNARLNNNRIDTKKAENKALIKQRDSFIKENRSRSDDEIKAFMDDCRKRGKSCAMETMERSETGKRSRVDCFSEFMGVYYGELIKSIPEIINALHTMSKEDFPTDYEIYDHDGKRYIQIDTLEEYRTTKDIREKYGLDCVAALENVRYSVIKTTPIIKEDVA